MSDRKKEKVLEAIVGTSLELAGLVRYADDSIVSKTLLDKSAGTLTLFAFDKGQSLSEHSTPYDAVVQVLDGTGTFIIGGEETKCAKGEVLVMPGSVPHSVRADKKFKMLLTMVRE